MTMQPLRVLLADDNESFRGSLAAFVGEQKGLELVGQAANGNEAVELADQYHPDLILMDLHMPECNGISAMQRIKGRSPSTKVIIISAHGNETYRMMAVEFGADGFIGKERMKSGLREVLGVETSRHERNQTASTMTAMA